MRWPTTFDEYAEAFDIVPQTADGYLRRFVPGYAAESDQRRQTPEESRKALLAALAAARRPARRLAPQQSRGTWHYPATGGATSSRPAPARRASSPSSAVRVAGPITEVRRSAGSPGTIAGYAAMFNKASVPLPFTEKLAPGAFRSTLDRVKRGEHDVLALTEHDTKNLLGRLSAGNLTLVEDRVGLRFTLELPNTQLGNDVRELVGRGILRGMSFSFGVVRDSWASDGGKRTRTVHDLLMFEVSVVSTPAYPSTSVSATRSIRSTTSDAFWTAARLRAVSARPTRGAAAVVAARSTPTREWR
jgi:HK97 family phage prohead protease